MVRLRTLSGVLMLLALVCGACDAERANPLDPRADNFVDAGTISGRITDRLGAGLSEGAVTIPALPLTVASDAEGRFSIADVPSGTYVIEAEKEGFAVEVDTLRVDAGKTADVLFHLDALPVVEEMQLETVHVSRWWPVDDLYALDVTARVDDADGVADVASVWIEVPVLGFADTLVATQRSGEYAALLPSDALPTGTLHGLQGLGLRLSARDRAGGTATTRDHSISRIIDFTPLTTSPQGSEPVGDDQPTLTWERPSLPYTFTYRIDVVRVDANIQNTVQVYEDVAATTTSLRVQQPLAAGSYFWVVWVVDDFGNRSRSKEAGFVVP